MLRPLLFLSLASVALPALGQTPSPAAVPTWVGRSDTYTHALLDVQLAHSPESASREGLAKFDPLISDPSLADELAQRHELEAALQRIRAAQATETDRFVRQDLTILLKAFDLHFREQDYYLAHRVPFDNASGAVFEGLHVLLDDQVDPTRRPAALERLRQYAGLAPGTTAFTQRLEQRAIEQMAKPDVVYPSKDEIEVELGRDANYWEGIPALFKKYGLVGWEGDFARLRDQLVEYDRWIRATILPKARTDFRLPPEEYRLNLEDYGIDLPPEELAAQGHRAFLQYQSEMAPLAVQVAKARGWPLDSGYRAVIAHLKHDQITGDAILPFYEKRLKSIEQIIVAQGLVSLPNRPAIIRLATAAETAQSPAPHMVAPALVHNTGERGQFVLPLNLPSATGGDSGKYDDFTFDAVAWTLTAHEARPGHELQFDSMVEHGVSLARAIYAANSTNVEGWGLYSEYIMQPYEPPEGQLLTLQLRLQRAARAFLDPELQSGKATPADAYRILEQDVGLSHAYAQEEVERFTFHSPGQAGSYFYGFTRLLQLRKEVEARLGPKFNQRKYHDFILLQGLLPPDQQRQAVLEEFVPAQ
jgi:Bacterial protein of unknown function (DUF885)